MQKLIERFNKKDTVLVISDYPETWARQEKNHGIAWYTKEFTSELTKRYKLRFVVLAEARFSPLRESPSGHSRSVPSFATVHDQGKTAVLRVFDQSHPTLFPRILKWLFKFNKIKNVQVHSEFCANGGLLNVILLLPFLLLIKLARRRVTYFAHNVVDDLTPLSTHINLKTDSFVFFIANKGLPIYYKLLSVLVDEFVVLDEAIKKRLVRYADPKKIIVLPLWLSPNRSPLSRTEARQKLTLSPKDFVLLYFGFITYYKGADWLIDAVQKMLKKKKFKRLVLVMAGGRAYSQKNNPQYQRYYRSILELARHEKRIIMTGFVKEKNIALYFKAADLAVLPYRDLMGASGSLIHALSAGMPVVVSDKMQAILPIDNKLTSDITFSHDIASFELLIAKAMKKSYFRRLKKVAKELSVTRNRKTVVAEVYEKLFTTASLDYKSKKVYELAHYKA